MGHDTNATDAEKRTPLHYAVAYRCGLTDLCRSAGTCLSRHSCPSKGTTVISDTCFDRHGGSALLSTVGTAGSILIRSKMRRSALISIVSTFSLTCFAGTCAGTCRSPRSCCGPAPTSRLGTARATRRCTTPLATAGAPPARMLASRHDHGNSLQQSWHGRLVLAVNLLVCETHMTARTPAMSPALECIMQIDEEQLSSWLHRCLGFDSLHHCLQR